MNYNTIAAFIFHCHSPFILHSSVIITAQVSEMNIHHQHINQCLLKNASECCVLLSVLGKLLVLFKFIKPLLLCSWRLHSFQQVPLRDGQTRLSQSTSTFITV